MAERKELSVDVDEIVRSKRKTIALIVKPNGTVIVRAPLRMPERAIRQFVESHADWIARKRAKALAFQPSPARQYVTGETFLYLGSAYPLEIVHGQTQALVLDGHFKLADWAQGEAARAFEDWYHQQARQILSERVDLYARRHTFQYTRIGITSARTRWGSCSANGSLNFSWRLILAPIEAVDYVIVHELVHTVFHNHSRRFWKKVEAILPDYRERRNWLKANAQQVMI